ncbi:hypothetical protein HYT04_01970 [Candidatus Kaiserbacteria bacterium]|nr:hypothetical protein [Candidatus Kaiserbacteria bacterium]
MNRDAFFRLYPNLPIAVRKEAVVVLDDGRPISWDVAFQEISAESALGDQILKKLFEMGILKDENEPK